MPRDLVIGNSANVSFEMMPIGMQQLMIIKRRSIMQSNLVGIFGDWPSSIELFNNDIFLIYSLIYICADDRSMHFFLGQIKFAELLVNYGVNINVADENHNTALHYAVNAGNLLKFVKNSQVSSIK